MDADYGLLVSFDDQSPNYVHGFEAGQLWEMLATDKPIEKRSVHVENIEVIQRMASRQGWIAEITPYDETWCILTTHKA